MKLVDTDIVEYWPAEVLLGVAHISEHLAVDLLSDEELKAFNGFTHNARKNEFLSARHLFWFLLEQAEIKPEQVTLRKEESGKPFGEYQGKKIYVSFSHSPEKVFCAISTKTDIGLDVEPVGRNVNQRLLKRILNEAEWETLQHEPLLKLWTIKEAAVKNLGTGLRTNLNELTIKQQGKQYIVEFNDNKRFDICSFRHSQHQITLAF